MINNQLIEFLIIFLSFERKNIKIINKIKKKYKFQIKRSHSIISVHKSSKLISKLLL